ncbi:hypothetical protein V8C42DRAFT_347306 [Trichoderma barbatum]
MANPVGGQFVYQQQLHPTYPSAVTSTTESPSQSLLAKQRNLVQKVTTTEDQNKKPSDGPDKEVLVGRICNTGSQTPGTLVAQIEHEMQQKTST